MRKTVAVFFGGRSNEHEISIITGMYAVNLLGAAGYEVLPVYLPREGGMSYTRATGVKEFAAGTPAKSTPAFLLNGALYDGKRHKRLKELSCALNCCHGGAGEDGTLSALLAWNGIPSASPQAPVSGVFMDKTLGKNMARGLGIPVLDGVCVREGEPVKIEEFPVIVKPVTLGSSIGIRVAESEEELQEALSLCFRLDASALVEPYLRQKRDVNCAAYRRQGQIVTSECEEVFSDESILTFHEKYERSARHNQLPADLPEDVAEKIKEYTARIYDCFHCIGVVRADFLVADGKPYFNELNTVPGSLASYLFATSLLRARTFLSGLVEEALCTPVTPKETVRTEILSSAVFTGAKAGKRH